MRRFVSALCFTVVIAPDLPAQDSALTPGRYTIRGMVLDTADVPIADAAITVYGLRRTGKTNRDGEFVIKELPAETRVLEVVALGYSPRLVTAIISGNTRPLTIYMGRAAVVLDSVQTVAARESKTEPLRRRRESITAAELSEPSLRGRNAMEAFELLRPQYFAGRPWGGMLNSDAARRAQMYVRDSSVTEKAGRAICVGVRACDIDSQLSVSINEGPLGSPDVLTTLSVAIVREMKYLPPVDATVRFGIAAGGGPVLVVYTK